MKEDSTAVSCVRVDKQGVHLLAEIIWWRIEDRTHVNPQGWHHLKNVESLDHMQVFLEKHMRKEFNEDWSCDIADLPIRWEDHVVKHLEMEKEVK